MSWFGQLSLWDNSPEGQEKWRVAARNRGETFAIAVLQRWNRDRLVAKYGCINSEFYANDLAMQINCHQGYGLFRVQCGGDSWDNPCMSVVFTDSISIASLVVEMCGKENTEVVEI